MAKMLETSLKLCRSCVYSWRPVANDVQCHYLLSTGNRRGCPVGYCDKYEKSISRRKKECMS